jgi:hypothetical protein
MNRNAQGNPSIPVISSDLKVLSDNLTSTNIKVTLNRLYIQKDIQKHEEIKYVEP